MIHSYLILLKYFIVYQLPYGLKFSQVCPHTWETLLQVIVMKEQMVRLEVNMA